MFGEGLEEVEPEATILFVEPAVDGFPVVTNFKFSASEAPLRAEGDLDDAFELDGCLKLLPRLDAPDTEEALCIVLLGLAAVPQDGVEKVIHRDVRLLSGRDDTSLVGHDGRLWLIDRAMFQVPVLGPDAGADAQLRWKCHFMVIRWNS
jgi:hypothetical protein